MPKVLEEGGFAIRIYLPPREHEPAHVHVVGGDGEIIINLGAGDQAPEIREVYGMTGRDALRAFRLVETHRDRLLEKWREYHG